MTEEKDSPRRKNLLDIFESAVDVVTLVLCLYVIAVVLTSLAVRIFYSF